jgi:glutamate-1-semialdehyde 2,1-aminomutase
MAAGLKTLELISQPGFYEQLSQKTEKLITGLQERAKHAGISLAVNQVGGMFGLFFTEDEKISLYAQVTRCDQERFKRFFHGMLEQGIYLAPSSFEAGFVSAAHSDKDIEQTLNAAAKVFQSL